MNKLVLLLFLLAGLMSCNGQEAESQIKNEEMTGQKNPLICDIESGTCETPGASNQTNGLNHQGGQEKVKVIYFTDPICSSCWGIEPQLRKLKLAYGSTIEIEYRMGGLLPDWSYNSGGISKPSDVAHHWDEVSLHYDMPIDGDIWLEDPLDSSYPPSIAFKAAEMQNPHKAIDFMREIREMVFLEKKNITKWEYIALAAENVGINVEQLKIDFDENAEDLFKKDLELSREFGVRGFPTMFFINAEGNSEKVYGSKPYSVYESAIIKSMPGVTESSYNKDPLALFSIYRTMTAREFAEISGIARNESEKLLDDLTKQGLLYKLNTKNGAIWRLK